MKTITVLYCHATGHSIVTTRLHGGGPNELHIRNVQLTSEMLKSNIFGWLAMGYEVTLRSV